MLDAKHRQALRGQAHALKPVVIIGAHGITDGVLAELEVAIHAHELVKIRLPQSSYNERDEKIKTLSTASRADIVGHIGRVLILYRPRPAAARKY